ncbi:MAG: hypothetical protein R6X02_06195 [Enhygromyxa sp.]
MLASVGACEAEHEVVELRAEHEGACTVEPGDSGDYCVGGNCAIEHDYVIRCPGAQSVEDIQLGINNQQVWGSFLVQGEGRRSFRIKGPQLELVDPLPGLGFASPGEDGTLHRHLDGPGYLQSKSNGWEQVEVAGLPANYDARYGFRLRPKDGVLHAGFRTGTQSGAYQLATLQDGQWSWIQVGSWDPNVIDDYLGFDSWGRTISLVNTGDADPGPQTFLRIDRGFPFAVGGEGELGRVAEPGSPQAGGEVPIAMLRRQDEGLELLAVVDQQDWSATILPDTEALTGVCPLRYNPTAGECPNPQCISEVSGVERGAYQLGRTTGGELWAAWLATDATVQVDYSLTQVGAFLRCLGTPSSDASAVLHLAQLAADGSATQSLQLPIAELGFLPTSGGTGLRHLGMSAFNKRVVLAFAIDHGDGEVAVRVLVIKTQQI